MIWLDLIVVLVCIIAGARLGGIGLGTVAALGMSFFVFGLGRVPGQFPGEVLLIVLCVVTLAASLQAAGGLDLMVSIAEKALRRHPSQITFLAPLISYLFTFVSGTGHVSYSLLPIIAEVARKVKERPERPLSISVIASQAAVTASPMSAATAGMVALLSRGGRFGLTDILLVCIPSTLIGVLAGALAVRKMGLELDDDPVYQQRLSRGEVGSDGSTEVRAVRAGAKSSVLIFVGAVIVITLLGLAPGLRPEFLVDGEPQKLSMVFSISLVTLSATAWILFASKVSPDAVVTGSVMKAGIVAVISILGIAWLGSTFFENHQAEILGSISTYLQQYPLLFSFALFLLSILLYSQAATVAALMPVGLQLGLAPPLLLAMFPAVNGYFFLPTYATIVAAIQFDSTGTTSIGKWVLNHSFMRPGLVTTVVALVVGFAVSRALYGS
ncbi:MAG TPA: anaerobic C4-dicarboxylate transporter family protein [Bryobacteraceae bacterium]|nr:anaerobic C4-dicarboxylate transporter family protein [Bryobacteraceae bacterium]